MLDQISGHIIVQELDQDIAYDSKSLSDYLDTPVEKSITEIEAYIKDNPEEVNKSVKYGFTPIMMSAYWNREDQVKLLIDNGADVNAVSESGDNALIEAARSDNGNMCKLLIDNGANVNHVNNDGCSALHITCRNNVIEASKILLQNGANPNLQDANGDHILHSLDRSQVTLAKILIKNGAVPNYLDQDGNTAKVLSSPDLQKHLIAHPELTTEFEPPQYVLNNRRDNVYIGIDNTEDALKILEKYDNNGIIEKLKTDGSIELSSGETIDLSSDSPTEIVSAVCKEIELPDYKMDNLKDLPELSKSSLEIGD